LIDQNWHADIRRIARFTLRDTDAIDYLSDRIRPWVRLHLPPYGSDHWVEWPMGTFLLTAPERESSASGTVTREVQAHDLLKLYTEDAPEYRYIVNAGASYTATVRSLLGVGVPMAVTDHPGTLPTAREWAPGTSKLRIINDLLSALNYEALHINEYGVPVAQPYVPPSQRAEEYTYADETDAGLIAPMVRQSLDLFNVPNKWVMVVSEPDRPPLVASYTNSDPTSPTSTVRRGRTITAPPITDVDAMDQTILDAKVARRAFEASQLYEHVEFSSALMPIHSGNDVYRVRFAPLALNAKYVETAWRVELRAGASMTHWARRMVQT
jgi:hypothetical protein